MPEERERGVDEEPLTVTEEAGAAPAEEDVFQTREGRGVRSLAQMLAILQVIGLMILVGAMVSYHTAISEGMELRGYAADAYSDVVETADVMVGPWILGVPVLALFVGAVAYGLWTIRGWGRRLALILCVLLVVVGIGLAQMIRLDIDQSWLMADAELDAIEGAGDDESQDLTGTVLGAATGLAVFYGIILGLLLLPTVGRVFALAEAQLHAREARFKIDGAAPRDHFVVERDVAQL